MTALDYHKNMIITKYQKEFCAFYQRHIRAKLHHHKS